MDIFRYIEESFAARTTSRQFARALAGWRERRPGLASLGGVDDIARASRGLGPRNVKDDIHGALCTEASGKDPDELAGLLLCWLFLPGLIGAAGELCSSDEADPEDVAADLLAGFLEAVAKVGATSTHIARHLMRGARLRALTALRKVETSATQEIAGEVEGTTTYDPSDPTRVLLEEAVRRGIVSAVEVRLVFAEREALAELAAKHGLTSAAARQGKVRARNKLAVWLSESSRDPLAS